jgi:hypothetical protein
LDLLALGRRAGVGMRKHPQKPPEKVSYLSGHQSLI